MPLVFLNPSVVAAQDNRTAATGCLTIESAGAATELEWKLICLASAYEHWSDAFDGPHDTGTTGNLHYETENRLVWNERERRKEERELVYISIRERPAEIEDRAIPGHWEGDLISGTKNSHIVTLVERHSRYTTLIKIPSKETTLVVAALSRHIRKLPVSLRRSLTWDRGHEMAQHKTFSVATDVKVYFCDPHSPWQRGTNENTNRLLRQYLPKKMDLSRYTQSELDKIALRLNQRPRKTLEFQTPASKLQASVASTC